MTASLHLGIERRMPRGVDRRVVRTYPTTTLRIAPKADDETPLEITCLGDVADLDGLVITVLQHDAFTRMHLVHVNRLAAGWLPHLGFTSEEERVFIQAALLHDAGKIIVDERLILAERELTPEEHEVVRKHVEYGVRLLLPYPRLQRTREIVAQHHEWFDGNGYPAGLSGESINPLARALSVADAFSAMTLDRSYHRGVSREDALVELTRCAGTQFDPVYVKSFCKHLRELERP
ncbi:HD domain-containing protein [bacterium]|nr:MAG: HD domain-containing protein [bacterium]